MVEELELNDAPGFPSLDDMVHPTFDSMNPQPP